MSSKEWAVKLRPQTLEQMAGQESNKLIIKSWIDNDNLPNALIFYGKSGTGKTSLSRMLGLLANAEVIELDAASHNSVDDARQINELAGRLSLTGKRKIFIIDECFVAGTKISTPKGPVNIEDIKPGDVVKNIVGEGKVLSVFKKPTALSGLVEVKYNTNCRAQVTKDHLYLTQRGWVQAQYLVEGDVLYGETLSDMWKASSSKRPEDLFQAVRDYLSVLCSNEACSSQVCDMSEGVYDCSVRHSSNLLKGMRIFIDRLEKQRTSLSRKSKAANAYKQSDVQSRYCEEGSGNKEFSRNECIQGSRREWAYNQAAKIIVGELGVTLGDGVGDTDWCEECGKRWISDLLQGGYWSLGKEDSDRGGWRHTLLEMFQIAGCQEDELSSKFRVDSVEISEQGSGQQSRADCNGNTETTIVYDLQVEGHPSYFANGAAVHNCHMLSQQSWNVLLKSIEEPNPKVTFIFCMSEDSLVETERGTLKIKDVLPTDKVFDGKSFKQVKAVYNNGQRECLRITLANGQTIDCTPDHKIKVLQGLHEVWREAKDLVVGNNLAVYHSYKAQTSAGLSRAECWMLGHMIGDGSYDQHGVCLHASTSKLDGILSAVNELIKQGILVDTAFSKRTIDNPNFKEIQLHFGAKGPKEWLDKCGVDYNYIGSERQKHLPTSVYSMSKEEFMSFVAGWYEADGSIWKYYSFFDLSEGAPQLSCYNESLYKDLLTLLISHGFDARIFIDQKSMGGVSYIGEREVRPTKPSASVYLRKQSGYFNEPALGEYLLEHSSYTNYKNERIVSATALKDSRRRISPEMLSTLPELSGNKWFTQIVKIEPIGIKTVYDLEVPESHCFVANNVVVHNCTTEYTKLPFTIRGRSRMLKFYSIPREQQVEYAKAVLEHEGYTLPEDVIDLVVDQSNGQMRDLLKLLQTTCEAKLDDVEKLKKFLAIPDNKGMRNFINAVLSGNPKNGVKVLNEIDTDLLEWVAALQKHIYQLLEDKYGITPINTKDITTYNKIKALENKFTDRQFGALLTELNKVNRAETAYAQLYALLFRGIDV